MFSIFLYWIEIENFGAHEATKVSNQRTYISKGILKQEIYFFGFTIPKMYK